MLGPSPGLPLYVPLWRNHIKAPMGLLRDSGCWRLAVGPGLRRTWAELVPASTTWDEPDPRAPLHSVVLFPFQSPNRYSPFWDLEGSSPVHRAGTVPRQCGVGHGARSQGPSRARRPGLPCPCWGTLTTP